MGIRATKIKNRRPVISEGVFTTQLITAAKIYGWRICHFRPAMDSHGRWKTALQGDPGWPDLVMAKGGWLIFAELKSDIGALSDEQIDWMDVLGSVAMRCAPMVRCFVWRPKDYDSIIEILSK